MKLRITNKDVAMNCCAAINALEPNGGYEVTILPYRDTRSNNQNRLLWKMLGEISEQVNWYGNKLTPENWKDVLTASLKKQTVVPAIDSGFVVCGTSTRKMTVKEMNELIDLMDAFGAQHNVRFSAQNTVA